jgi:hypothetical protein
MPSAHASSQPLRPVRRLAGRFPSLAEPLRAGMHRLAGADARVAATATLLAVMASAAVTFALSPVPAATAKKVPAPALANAEDAAAVKMIGATPRGENCADQVWPYIERRCLARAADKPQTNPAATSIAPDAGPSRPGDTTGAAPAGGGITGSFNPAVERRVATAGLWLPPRLRSGELVGEPLSIPPGATAPGSLAASRYADDGWSERAMEQWIEPRRRIGRRGYGYRYGRGWGRRHLFPF